MQRRNFIRYALAGTAGSLFLPAQALAGEGPKLAGAGGLFYTAENPGRWEGKAGGHMPQVTPSRKGKRLEVEVVTGHEMNGYEHYIVKHVLLDQNLNFLAENLFDPKKDPQPVSQFTLEGYSGRLIALSVCNLHDTWLEQVEV